MKYQITYGAKTLSVEIPEKNLASIVRPHGKKTSSSTQIDLSKFEAFVQGNEPILFIVNDGSRPTPTAEVLKQLHPLLESQTISFIIATGTHRAPTESELEFIFGSNLSHHKNQIYIHDARDKTSLKYFGETSRGTSVHLNKLLEKFEKIVVIGSVEPHYFAGYTGGRKGFLPGIAGYQSIEQNHKLAMQPGSQPLQLDGNPVHEDLTEALKFLNNKKIFSIMTVLDIEDQIYSVFSGDIESSFNNAVASCQAYYSVQIKQKVDLVITIAAPPLDATLYQAHKAIENVRGILKEGGQLVLVAPCQEGLGNDTFVQLLQSHEDPQKVLDFVRNEYRLGYHKASRLAELALSAQIYILSNLEDDLVESIFFNPIKNLQAFIDSEIMKNPSVQIVAVDKGTVVVPILKI